MRFSKDIARVGLCVLAAILVLEFAMRAAGERFQASFYIADVERGYALRPRSEGWDVGEQENYVRINSRGLRDREHDLHRPPDTIRIAVLGDSESEAVQVALERTYFSILERTLNEPRSRRPKVEVVNFGVGGYGLGPQYLTLRKQIWQYDPQIVLVVNSIDSFILRSSRRLYPGDSFGAPFFELRDGALAPDEQSARHRTVVPTEGWSADLMNQSRLLSLLNSSRVKATTNVHQLLAEFHPQAANPSRLPDGYWKTYGFLGPATPELQDAWKTSEALILAMRDEVSLHGAEFWVCVIDSPAQADPDPRQATELQQKLGLDTLFRGNRLFDEFLSQKDVPYIDLAPELARVATKRNVVLHGFKGMPRNTGHLNEIGHEAVGRLLAQSLAEQSSRLQPTLQSGAK
jgi:hypothetical protein